ncbi:helix-turn-helix domain-containing protein [Cryomorphaceae bacterium]|nr:helix-turn-helix domain-containing protein [Cryomorphaceae bacterium]
MSNQVTLVQLDPEAFKKEVLAGFRKEVETLRKEFQPKEPQVFLTRNEVAELFKINLSTVHHWTKSGRLMAYGIGGRVYYKRKEVEALALPLKVNND